MVREDTRQQKNYQIPRTAVGDDLLDCPIMHDGRSTDEMDAVFTLSEPLSDASDELAWRPPKSSHSSLYYISQQLFIYHWFLYAALVC